MYAPPSFKQDRSANLAFAEERGFGMSVQCCAVAQELLRLVRETRPQAFASQLEGGKSWS
jgi:hypothetical protein